MINCKILLTRSTENQHFYWLVAAYSPGVFGSVIPGLYHELRRHREILAENAYIARSNLAAFSVRLLQLQQVAENPSLEKEEFLCACHSNKQSLGFLNKDPQNQVLFN